MNANTVERLWRSHNDRALRRLRTCLGNLGSEVAEDALSDAWVILARKPDDYLRDEGPQLHAWLVLVARRLATRGLREDAPDALDHRTYADTSGNTTTDATVCEQVAQRMLVRELLAIVREDQAPEPNTPHATLARRQAILARMIGLSYAELGELTGYTYTKVNRSTAEGRELLRSRGLDA